MGNRQRGMKVLIVEDCRDGFATGQTATYTGESPAGLGPTPAFLLQDGSTILGCECWWTPVVEAGPLEHEQDTLQEGKKRLRKIILEG